MKGPKTFDSQFRLRTGFAQNIGNDEIKNEPMFFNSDLEFAYENSGPITRSFIENLPLDWKSDVIFDSRVHMLMPGWYPAIPGYHHDDVPRPPIPVGQHFATAGQPDYDNPRYLSRHILGLVNGDICPTHFAVGRSEFSQIHGGELIYRQWHQEVMAKLETGELSKHIAPDRTLVEFDWQTWHTGSKAVRNGWRWFGRVSRDTDRVLTPSNEIRHQVQVYMEFPMEGW